MSEITEQEAKEAVARLNACRHEDDTDPDDPHDEQFPNAHKVYGCRQIEACIHVGYDLRTLSDYAMQELSRRDAERAEREKPIDVIVSELGWAPLECDDEAFRGCPSQHYKTWLDWQYYLVLCNGCVSALRIPAEDNSAVSESVELLGEMNCHGKQATTEQLLDLLRALKGGAS